MESTEGRFLILNVSPVLQTKEIPEIELFHIKLNQILFPNLAMFNIGLLVFTFGEYVLEFGEVLSPKDTLHYVPGNKTPSSPLLVLLSKSRSLLASYKSTSFKFSSALASLASNCNVVVLEVVICQMANTVTGNPTSKPINYLFSNRKNSFACGVLIL